MKTVSADRLEILRSYDVEDVQSFLKTRRSDVIPAPMQRYIMMMDKCSVLISTNGPNMTVSTEELRRCFPDLSYTQARRIYYDALDYFHVDEHVSAAAWDAIYADQFDKLQQVALEAGKLAVAEKCMEKAHELRTMKRQASDYKWQAPVCVINVSVKPESLGYRNRKIMDIARRREDEEYRKMIESLETTPAEKQRMLSDAGIQASIETDVQMNRDEYEPDEQ